MSETPDGAAVSQKGLVSVFLDWFGCIADREASPRHFREAAARLLRDRFGGTLEDGRRANDQAFAWYMEAWPERLAGGDYATVYREMETEWVFRLLRAYGRPFAGTAAEAFAFGQQFTHDVATQVDLTYPDVRPCLEALRAMGCRLYPSSGAGIDYLRGLLRGAALEGYFDGVVTGEMVNAHKRHPDFWRGLLGRTGADPTRSVAVDDDARALGAAAAAGLTCLILDRQGRAAETDARFTRLEDLRRLPEVVARRFGLTARRPPTRG